MIQNWRAHGLRQIVDSVKALEEVPDYRRTRHFLDSDLADAARTAHQIASLNITDGDLSKRLKDHSHRIDEMRATLNNYYEIRGDLAPRAAAVAPRKERSEMTAKGNPQ